MQELDIGRLCKERGWSRARLVLELRKHARRSGIELPSDDSLKRMLRQWSSGARDVSPMYAGLLSAALGVDVSAGGEAPASDDAQHLRVRLARARTAVDAELVELFEMQTHTMRALDRRLGAAQLLEQGEAHVRQMSELLTSAVDGPARRALAAATAEGAALAGWQALDLGFPDRSWRLHEMAKSAARESGDAVVLAHVTAQQGYALLELDRAGDALAQMTYAREVVGRSVPSVMRAWLLAAEAEAASAAGDSRTARSSLDEAANELAASGGDALPFLFLDDVHLARWRGNCLARLGDDEAVEWLVAALRALDPSFTRAKAALHCDLAIAYLARKELDAVDEHARDASALADVTMSVRQRRRVDRLLKRSA